jgi:hypothetical protein
MRERAATIMDIAAFFRSKCPAADAQKSARRDGLRRLCQ